MSVGAHSSTSTRLGSNPWGHTILLLATVLLYASCAQQPRSAPTPAQVTPTATALPTSAVLSTPTLPSPSKTSPSPTHTSLGQIAYQHIRVLSQQIGPRPTTTAKEREAAQYIASKFQEYGYTVQLPTFTIPMFSDAQPKLSIQAPVQEALETQPLARSATGQVSGPLVYVGLGRTQDFANQSLAGKIALMERGTIMFQEKVDNATRAGALAAVIYNNRPGIFQGVLPRSSSIPALSISLEDGGKLLRLMQQGQVTLQVNLTRVQLPSQNVLAIKPSASSKTVVLGAHYDSVPDSPGANDNASGTAVLLALAQEIAKRSFPFTLHLVAFGAEEIGLVGSASYVSALSPQERGQVIAMVSLDALGTGQSLEVTGTSSLVDRAKAIAQREQIPLAVAELPPGASSDHASFQEAGIPAILLAASDYSRIHTPEDRIDFVSQDRLNEAASLMRALLEELARGLGN